MANMTLLGFINHLAQFQHHLHTAQHAAFQHVAEIVEKEAKHEIGTYQAAAGPFAGWAELADATKDDRSKKGFPENEPGLRTGQMRDSINHAYDDTGAVIGSDDDKLVRFELGTTKQPPRSVLGTAVIHKEPEISHTLGSAVVGALTGQGVHNGWLKII